MEKYNNWKRKFYAIWAGQAVSLITSAILQMAIIFYLTEKTGSAMVLSMASLVGFLPYAILGPAIGVLVDRHDRKKIMIGADLIIAAAGAVLAIVAFCMELPVWMIMIVLFIRSIGTAFHTPALNAVTPLLVPEEQLTKCAGYSQSLQSISYIVSPAVAALLYSVWDLNAIIAIDVLGAVIASITVAIVRIPKLGNQVQSLEPNFIREMKEGVVVLRQNKGLFALLLLGTLYTFVYMPINALFPLISMEHFNGTPVPYFYYGNFLCIWDASRRLIIRKIRGLRKACITNNKFIFYNGDQFSRFGNTSSKWICNIRSLLCNNGAFGAIL